VAGWRLGRRWLPASTRGAAALPAWVDRRLGLRDLLVSLVELERPPLALVDRAAHVQRSLESAALFPWRPTLRRALMMVALPAWVAMAVVALWPSAVIGAARALFATPVALIAGAGSTEPELIPADLMVHIVAPAYAGLPDRRLENAAGDFDALAGSTVRLSGNLGTGWSQLSLVVEGGKAAGARLNEDGSFDATFETEAAGGWSLRALDAGGVERSSREHRVGLIPDGKPRLTWKRFEHPDPLLPGDTVAIEAVAEDDLGLGRWRWAILADGKETQSGSLEVDGRRSEAAWSVEPFALLPLDASDVLIRLEAWDGRDTDAGHAVLDRFLPLLTPERAAQVVEQEVQRLFELSLTRLAEQLEQQLLDPRSGQRDRWLREHEDNEPGMRTLFRSARALTEALTMEGPGLNLPWMQQLRDELPGVLDQLALAWTSREQFVRGTIGRSVRSLGSAQLREGNRSRADLVEGLEELVLTLDRSTRQRDMDAALVEAMSVEDAVAELQRALEALKNGEAGAEERVRAALEALKQAMSQLGRALAEMQDASALNDFSNQQMQESSDLLAEMEKLLEEGNIEDLIAAAEQALETAQAMSGSLRESGASSGGSMSPEEMAALMEAMEEAAALEQEQQELADQLFDPESGKMDPAALRELKRQVERAQEAIAKMGENDGGEGLRAATERDLERAARALERLAQEAETGRHEAALQQSNVAEANLRRADAQAQLAEQSGGSGQSPRQAAAWERSNGQAMDAIEEIQEILNRAEQRQAQPGGQGSPQPGAQGAQPGSQPGGEAGRQAGLRERLNNLGESMQAGPVGGMLPGSATRAMRQAGSSMEEAQTQLEAAGRGEAQRPAQDAAEHLGELRESLEGALQQGQGGGQPGGRRSGNSRDWRGPFEEMLRQWEPSQIPDPGNFVPDEELRERLLEGSGEQVPEAYEPSRDAYFEELLE
jgi:hypothetical protein